MTTIKIDYIAYEVESTGTTGVNGAMHWLRMVSPKTGRVTKRMRPAALSAEGTWKLGSWIN